VAAGRFDSILGSARSLAPRVGQYKKVISSPFPSSLLHIIPSHTVRLCLLLFAVVSPALGFYIYIYLLPISNII
jgi:hypothetical protein